VELGKPHESGVVEPLLLSLPFRVARMAPGEEEGPLVGVVVPAVRDDDPTERGLVDQDELVGGGGPGSWRSGSSCRWRGGARSPGSRIGGTGVALEGIEPGGGGVLQVEAIALGRARKGNR